MDNELNNVLDAIGDNEVGFMLSYMDKHSFNYPLNLANDDIVDYFVDCLTEVVKSDYDLRYGLIKTLVEIY